MPRRSMASPSPRWRPRQTYRCGCESFLRRRSRVRSWSCRTARCFADRSRTTFQLAQARTNLATTRAGCCRPRGSL